MHLKKGDTLSADIYEIKEGETSPPKRYTSGSIILTMENAGQFIEDEELRAQIKGSGIGTSATRAEILKKLVNIEYLALNKKTQVLTPTQMGEMIYDVVSDSIRPLLNPALTVLPLIYWIWIKQMYCLLIQRGTQHTITPLILKLNHTHLRN